MPRPGSSVVSPKLARSLERARFWTHRVDIRRPTSQRAASGAPFAGAGTLVLSSVPARMMPTTQGEIKRADGTIVVDGVRVELGGAYESIVDTDVLIFEGKTYNIITTRRAPADGRVTIDAERVS